MPGETVSLCVAFAAQVARNAHHLAVKTRASALSYRDLDLVSNRIAQAILESGRGLEPAAVFIQNRAKAIAAIFGVLKAGKIYLPLDPDHPASRIEFMLADAGADLVITDNENLSHAKSLNKPILNIDALHPEVPDTDPRVSVDAAAPAWILYTSGSTGRPKGVLQTHRNVLRFVQHYRTGLGITPRDRYVLLFSPVVNAGAHVIFSTLLNGATLYPIDLKTQGMNALPAWLSEQRITLYYSVPTVFRHLMDVLDGSERFDSMRLVMLGGEPMYRRDADQFARRFPAGCKLVNRLGSSETGTIGWWFVDPEQGWPGQVVPVGLPVPDHEICIADDAGQAVAPGAVGEIVVRSAYLSPGYWRHDELTAQVFSPAPPDAPHRSYRTGDVGRMLRDGRLVCLGRKDAQVKVRGYRVEPGEIEQALLDLPAVKQAFVMAVNTDTGARLTAYLVAARRAPEGEPGWLRHQLKSVLPDYMLPDHYVWLEALPMAPNGKVDRRALPAPQNDADAPVDSGTPDDPVQRRIAEIWCEVLDRSHVGVGESFLDLGGNSLRAARVLNRIERDFNVTLPLAAMFEASTVAALAALVAASAGELPPEYRRKPAGVQIDPAPEPESTLREEQPN